MHGLVPICPRTPIPRKGATKGVPQTHPCLSFHSQNPTYHPHGKQVAKPRRAKRARTVGAGRAAHRDDVVEEEEDGEEDQE